MALPDAGAQAASIPIIDTHIHLFDTRRPQGVPWPDKKDAILYQPALPDRYRKIAAHGSKTTSGYWTFPPRTR